MSHALTGLKVIDLSRVLAGPYCTMLLADYGAEVIKIEQPESGDGTRQWGPPWLGDQSAYFLSVNRNKKSLTLNLKDPAGQQILHQLLTEADVFIENFLPGTLQKMGLDYASLAEKYPQLIYCSISGYGQNGPYRDRPGYDFAIQAQGGLMSITGPADGEPYKVGVAIADITTGLFAVNAILAALHYRTTTGRGQYIDVALLDAQIAWLANVAQNYLVTGQPAQRYGNAHPSIVPYETFPTADGYLALAVGTDGQYQRLCELGQQPHLAQDERFRLNRGRVQNRQELVPLLQEMFRSHPTTWWLEQLTSANIPCAPINDVATALHDPQVRARGMVQTVQHTTLGEIEVLGPVAKLSETPAGVWSAPPVLGEHTTQVLTQLGYTAGEIEALQKQKIV